MDRPETPVTRWLRASRGAMSQADLVADLERVTGWHLLRENYSKYETGRMVPEPDTLARFEAYWRSRGVAGPDLSAAKEEPSLEERAVIAAEAQAAAIADLVDELRRWRSEDRVQIGALQDAVAGLLGAVHPIERAAAERRVLDAPGQ